MSRIKRSVLKALQEFRFKFPPMVKVAIRTRLWDETLAEAMEAAVKTGIQEHLQSEQHATNVIGVPGIDLARVDPTRVVGMSPNLCAPFKGPPKDEEIFSGGYVPLQVINPMFRKDPHKRRWETSYTAKVISNALWVPARSPELLAALALLRDYWHTQHEVFEQRDALRGYLIYQCSAFANHWDDWDEAVPKSELSK